MTDTPEIAELCHEQLIAARTAMLAVENGVGQDDYYEGWEQALWAASELRDAAEALYDRMVERLREYEREDEEAA